jgi:hypothetical protein
MKILAGRRLRGTPADRRLDQVALSSTRACTASSSTGHHVAVPAADDQARVFELEHALAQLVGT